MDFIHQGEINSLYSFPLEINWLPTFNCNYHCSYCNQHASRPKAPDWLNDNDIFKLFDNLLNLNRTSYVISISGGEPSIFPHLPNVLEHICESYGDKLNHVYLCTNGTLNRKLYENISNLACDFPFIMAISLHPEHVNIHNIKYIINSLANNVSLFFNLMFHPDMLGKLNPIFNALLEMRENFPFNLSINFLRELYNGEIFDRRYNETHLEWRANCNNKFDYIAKHFNKQIAINISQPAILANRYLHNYEYAYEHITDTNKAKMSERFNLKGMYCVPGTNLMNIFPDGTVANAICTMAKRTILPAHQANPYDDPEFCKIIKCRQPVCGCITNRALQKFVRREEAEDFLNIFNINRLQRESDFRKIKHAESIISRHKFLDAKIKPENFPLNDFVEQAFYYACYPDVADAGMSAVEHYTRYGWKEGRNPNHWFDSSFYLSQFTQPLDMNPLTHYILHGCLEGKLPKPQPDWYLLIVYSYFSNAAFIINSG